VLFNGCDDLLLIGAEDAFDFLLILEKENCGGGADLLCTSITGALIALDCAKAAGGITGGKLIKPWLQANTWRAGRIAEIDDNKHLRIRFDDTGELPVT
jgi:hypothetical protein